MTYDDLDVKLVNALLDDGRASLRSLADALDVSVTTVSNHLDQLQAEGVVVGFTPKIDYAALGYDVTAVIQLKVEGDAIGEISAALEGENRMVSVYEVTGDFDIIAIGKYEDTADMNDQIKDLLVHPAIVETNTSIVLNVISEHDQVEVPVES
ncbi:MAG: HTH-type transcriptional regulator Lrp [Halobacteriales archaeon]